MLAAMNPQRQLVFLFLIHVIYIRHHQWLQLRLQQREVQYQNRLYCPQEPISYALKIFRLDTWGWNEVDIWEYLR